MHIPSRRFAEWVTGLRSDSFRWARLKLTLVYLAIITVVVVVLSSAVYSFQTARFTRFAMEQREERRLEDVQEEAFEQSLTEYVLNIRRAIITGGIITIVVTGALSFFLAGRTLRPIRRALDSQRRFVANAAHDLRTPLTVMKTEAEVALKQPTIATDEAIELLRSQLEEIDHMSAMVEQMLMLIRTGRDSHSSQDESQIDFLALTKRAARKLEPLAQSHGVSVTIEPTDQSETERTGMGDELALERAILNVLQNALTYTPSGGEVSLSVEATGSSVEIVVQDTGIGIAPEDLIHVTEPFFRADSARGVRGTGAGLGLSIVKETIATHGGSLTIDSNPGAGTRVTLRMPRLRRPKQLS